LRRIDSRGFVLFINGGNATDEESFRTLRPLLSEFGLGLESLSVTDPQASTKLKTILHDRGGTLFCFMSSNFWALNIRNDDRLIHTLTGIPLVIFLHDHPVYFLHLVSRSLDGTIMFAVGDDCADFIRKHYRLNAKVLANPAGPKVSSSNNEPYISDFLARRNELFCPINLTIYGLTIDDVWAAIKALPAPRRKRVARMIDLSLTDCFTPLHIISENLTADGDAETDVDDLQWVLNFVKLWRRLRIVEMLIDLPITVGSEYVPADWERKYPTKFVPLTVPQTIVLYRNYRFVLNSNPLMNAMFHDRVTQALQNNAVCVTDPNTLLASRFRDEHEMLFIDYTRNDLAEKVQRYLDAPERAFALTLNCFKQWRGKRDLEDAFRGLIAAVEGIRPPPP
jgi:hypothetical protein